MRSGTGTATKQTDDTYTLRVEDLEFQFESLNELMAFAAQGNIEVVGSHAYGYRVGALAVEFSEGGIDRLLAMVGLEDSTDGSYARAAHELAEFLHTWADQYERRG